MIFLKSLWVCKRETEDIYTQHNKFKSTTYEVWHTRSVSGPFLMIYFLNEWNLNYIVNRMEGMTSKWHGSRSQTQMTRTGFTAAHTPNKPQSVLTLNSVSYFCIFIWFCVMSDVTQKTLRKKVNEQDCEQSIHKMKGVSTFFCTQTN